jgi:dynactin complex subunit
MEAMREAWTDDRMDDLARRVDTGFAQVHADLAGLRIDNKEIRHGLAQEGIELRQELKAQGVELRQEMNAQGEEFRQELKAQGIELRQELKAQGVELRQELKAQGEELRREIKAQGVEIRGELNSFREQTIQQFVALNRRLDTLQATLLAAILAGFIGLIASHIA